MHLAVAVSFAVTWTALVFAVAASRGRRGLQQQGPAAAPEVPDPRKGTGCGRGWVPSP